MRFYHYKAGDVLVLIKIQVEMRRGMVDVVGEVSSWLIDFGIHQI